MADAFQTESRRKPTRLQQVGRFLEGFGAGYRGEGREFLADLRAERDLRNQKLTDASIRDAQAIQRALSGNDPRQAIELLVDRANLLEGMGEDASDTYALRDMIIQGNNQGAISEVNTFLDAAKRRGLISAPAPIESKYITTDPSGRMGTVVPDASGGYTFREAAGAGQPKPAEPTTYKGVDNIERYSTGPYAGYSVGAIADMMRTGQIANFGDAVPQMTRQPQAAAQVRPPMRMPEATQTPDLYSGLSEQEAAILRAEQEQTGLERERAAAEEERRVKAEEREVKAAAREEEEFENVKKMKEAEMMQLYGLADRLLSPNIYSDKVYAAATGPLESKSPMLGAAMTFGADYQTVTDFRNDLQFLQDIATMENLGRMTGVLSQSDIQLLAQAATGIELSSKPEIVQQRLRLIRERIKDKLIERGYTPEQLAEQASMYTNAQSEFDSLLQELEGV